VVTCENVKIWWRNSGVPPYPEDTPRIRIFSLGSLSGAPMNHERKQGMKEREDDINLRTS
jgi:hypothetical protein